LEEEPLGTITSKALWKPTCSHTSLTPAKKKKKLTKLKIKRPRPKMRNQKIRKKESKMEMQRRRMIQLMNMRIPEFLCRTCHLKSHMRSYRRSLENMERLRKSRYH